MLELSICLGIKRKRKLGRGCPSFSTPDDVDAVLTVGENFAGPSCRMWPVAPILDCTAF